MVRDYCWLYVLVSMFVLYLCVYRVADMCVYVHARCIDLLVIYSLQQNLFLRLHFNYNTAVSLCLLFQ